jgi:hypothetical protein
VRPGVGHLGVEGAERRVPGHHPVQRTVRDQELPRGDELAVQVGQQQVREPRQLPGGVRRRQPGVPDQGEHGAGQCRQVVRVVVRVGARDRFADGRVAEDPRGRALHRAEGAQRVPGRAGAGVRVDDAQRQARAGERDHVEPVGGQQHPPRAGNHPYLQRGG